MGEPSDQDQRDESDKHRYGRRAYDQGPPAGHGPPSGNEDRRAAPDGRAAAKGSPEETHALQRSEPRALQKYEPTEHDQHRPPAKNDQVHEQDHKKDGQKHQSRDKDDQHQQPGKDAAQKHAPPKPTIHPRLPRLLLIGLIVALVVAGLAAGVMFWLHHRRLSREAERRSQEVDRGPKVFVTSVRTEPGVRDVTLPADVRGFSQATVYAKVAGYVKSIAVDKGDVVKQGQLLAVLESPEVDQQVAAAVADVEVKKRTYERYRHLVAKDFVSQQDYETAKAQYQVAEANVRQARAMQSYEMLRAPFSGTITARYVDPGALVPAATGSTQSVLPLVDIADLERLRILVFVQQDAAPFIHPGDLAELTVDERPDLKIKAPVTRLSSALDPRSRTMLCEIWLANERRLYPGTFVHVTLHLKMAAYPMVPSAALVIHDNRSALAVVRDDQVHFVPVKTGLDDGHDVQIKEGIQPGEKVALDMPAELADGARVQAEEKKAPESNQGGAPAKGPVDKNAKNPAVKPAGGQSAGGPQNPEKPKSPADKGSGKLSDDPMAGSDK